MGNKCKYCYTFRGNKFVAGKLMGLGGCQKCTGIVDSVGECERMIWYYTEQIHLTEKTIQDMNDILRETKGIVDELKDLKISGTLKDIKDGFQ